VCGVWVCWLASSGPVVSLAWRLCGCRPVGAVGQQAAGTEALLVILAANNGQVCDWQLCLLVYHGTDWCRLRIVIVALWRAVGLCLLVRLIRIIKRIWTSGKGMSAGREAIDQTLVRITGRSNSK